MPKNPKNLQQLDDTPQINKYQANPIQNYGLNLLRGMGFTQQRGIGFNKQNALNQPLVLKPRPKGLGLGAKPEDAVQQKPLFSKGDFIKITSQCYKGMIGIIKKVKKQYEVVIQLGISGTQLKLNFDQIQTITEDQYNNCKQRILKQHKQKKEENNQKKKRRLKWIIPNIRCKIIDKLSPYYLKKIIVNEVLSQRQFQCIYISQTGQKTYLRQITQKQLQTVLPKSEGIVLILNKKFKGQKAKLLERNKQEGEVVVQILETLEVENFNDNDVSEFVQL